jgi:glucose-1-phosphate adenylyltransferase
VPLGGKYRLIDVPVSNCINSDISRIFVLTQFNSASLNRHIGRAYRFDRFRQGFVTILAAEQTPHSKDWYQGTSDAVRQAMPHLRIYRHTHVLILSGDQLYSMDYRKMLAHHEANGADITIATIPVHANDAPGFGILKTDEGNIITEFYEKPPAEELSGKESPVSDEMRAQERVYLASMGIYIFSKQVLNDMLDQHPDGNDFGKQLIPLAIGDKRVISYPFTGYWSDIGTIASFYTANLQMAQPHPPFDLYNPLRPFYTNARMLPPAKIQGSNVDNAIIAEASVIINSTVSNSIIGLRSYIGPNSKIKNTVMMGADHYAWHALEERHVVEGPEHPGISEGSEVDGAIIDFNVSIGKRCVIKNRDDVQEGERHNVYIRDGVVVIPKNVSIPDDTII